MTEKVTADLSQQSPIFEFDGKPGGKPLSVKGYLVETPEIGGETALVLSMQGSDKFINGSIVRKIKDEARKQGVRPSVGIFGHAINAPSGTEIACLRIYDDMGSIGIGYCNSSPLVPVAEQILTQVMAAKTQEDVSQVVFINNGPPIWAPHGGMGSR